MVSGLHCIAPSAIPLFTGIGPVCTYWYTTKSKLFEEDLFKKKEFQTDIPIPPWLYFLRIFTLPSSVVDRHCFDADPDLNFHVDADPDPDPDRYQNDADSHADPTLSFTHIAKSNFCYF